MAAEGMIYGSGNDASIGASQMNDFFWQKKALIEVKKEQYFGQLSDVISMPKHFGKTIKRYHYLPLLSDANVNDQGIDAAGLTTTRTVMLTVTNTNAGVIDANPESLSELYFEAEGASDAAALAAAKVLYNTFARRAVALGGLGAVLTTEVNGDADFTTHTTTGGTYTSGVNPFDAGYVVTIHAGVARHGNLYGSSKDVGTIAAKLPALGETGGRVNRVGFKRVELEGTINKFGFFDEYSAESLVFDSDAQLAMHVNREMLRGANEITESALQIDLLNAAGVVRFGGDATQNNEISGIAGEVSLITYEDLMKLSIDLDNNRTPKATKMITGTRMVDTKVIDAARYMYIGSELIPMIKRMTDLFGNQAFVPAYKYAAGTSIAVGEIGTVDQFRVIVVPEMLHWAGQGKAEGTNSGYRATGGNYDIFPMLVVGSESFVNIGFQTDGKTVKFKIKHRKPESDGAYTKDDPYGEMGFMSIKWWYGFMVLRSERIALCKTVAEY